MKYILIIIAAIFIFVGAQAAEPRANGRKVNKVLKAMKNLNSNHINVEVYSGDSIAEDIKKQLYALFDDKKVDKAWKAHKITLCKSILVESQDEEGYKELRNFAAGLNIGNSEKLAGIPLAMSSNSDSVGSTVFTDKNNQFVFTDSLQSKKYSIIYTDDDLLGKSAKMLKLLVDDKVNSSMPAFNSNNAGIVAIECANDDEQAAVGLNAIINHYNELSDSVFHYVWRPNDAALYCALGLKDTTHYSVLQNADFDEHKYICEGEYPSIHFYEGSDGKGYDEMSCNVCFYLPIRHEAGSEIYDGTMKCVWAADTLGMHVRQYQGMKNVTVYMVDIPEKRNCATLIVNGGLGAFKAFFNSYTLNNEERVADKYNVIFTRLGDKVQSTKENVYGKKSGLHLKFPIFDEAYSKGALPLYKRSE